MTRGQRLGFDFVQVYIRHEQPERAVNVIDRDHRFPQLVLKGINLPGEFGALVSQRGYNVRVCHMMTLAIAGVDVSG